jgi:hypothetical protein
MQCNWWALLLLLLLLLLLQLALQAKRVAVLGIKTEDKVRRHIIVAEAGSGTAKPLLPSLQEG